MTNVVEFTTWQKSESAKFWENENKTKIIYLAYDCELMPMKITSNLAEVKKYCKENNVVFSEYPVGTYECND